MSFISYVFLSTVLLLAPLQAARDPVPVPAGRPIHIDGVLGDEEWSEAGVWELSGVGQLLMKYDSANLYLGLRGPGAGWAHVYVAAADRLLALHASAALGAAEYVRGDDEVYRPVREFEWSVRDTSQSETARLARTEFLESEGWVASTVWMGAPIEFEFIIARDLFEGGLPTVAVVFATGPGAYHYWPETLAGDALNEDLIEGNTPAELRFRTDGWARLDLGGRTARVETGYVEVEGGRLYYETAGQGDPLILIHGGFLDRRMWDGQFETFARHYRVIRYDVRAHGLSRTDSVEYADYKDLHDLMTALDVPRATLVGLSMGGVIATDFALTYPEMTAALVLVGPGLSGYPFEGDEIQEYVDALNGAFESGGLPAALEVFTRYWCDGPQREPSQVDPAVRQKVLAMLAGSEERWSYWNLSRPPDPPAFRRLAEIAVPTLAIVGGIDMPVVHDIVDLIAQEVPGAQKAVIPDVAHMVNMEKPDEFERLVLEFLESVTRAQPREQAIGALETVAEFHGPLPTGVTVSHGGRIFVNFPRWGDDVPATVVEIVDGEAVPYPNAEINQPDSLHPGEHFISVQSVVVDPADRLWILDTGLGLSPGTPGARKLVGVDLTTNRVFKTISFPDTVALPNTYLNDVRFDLRRGAGGMAFITDSSPVGGIIVVDLASGRSWRRLHGHASVRAEERFIPIVEGQPLMYRLPDGRTLHLPVGADGIALGADGERLYYRPLSSRRLYSVSVDALADQAVSDEGCAATVEDHGDLGFASDGLEADDEGRVYLTNYEDNAILVLDAEGSLATLVHHPRLLWPDTLSLAADGYLYVIANQLHRQAGFNRGVDRRDKPYSLFRVAVAAGPVLLN